MPNQLIVKLKSGHAAAAGSSRGAVALADAALSGLLDRFQARLTRPLLAQAHAAGPPAHALGAAGAVEKNGLDRVFLVESATVDISKLADRFARDQAVEYAEPNWIYEADYVPNDPYFSSSGSWGQPYADLWGLLDLELPLAWDHAQGNNVVVAVVDTGLDMAHDDIDGNVWVNTAEIAGNGIDDDNNGFVDDVHGWDFVNGDADPTDDAGHGTHVAGTIAATGNDGVGVVGVAPHARIMPVKSLDLYGNGSTAALANGIVYAANNGARVINNSWGGFGISRLVSDVVAYAHDRGAAVIASAGNFDIDVNIASPARIPEAITVAATDYQDLKASFSNWGDQVDVAAPGVDVLSLLASQATIDDNYPEKVVGTSYLRLDGTSMAAPHVSGLAALILSLRPDLTPEQVRFLLTSTAATIPEEHQRRLGAGIVRASEAIIYAASGQPIPDLFANISSPAPRMLVGPLTPVTIVGSAFGPSFQSYELAIAEMIDGQDLVFSSFATGTTPVQDGVLGALDLSGSAVAASYVIRLRVMDANGHGNESTTRISVDPTLKPGWPQVVGEGNIYEYSITRRTPALADIDADGMKEIVTTSDYGLHAWKADGSDVPGFPIALAYPPAASVTAADLDRDGAAEIIVPCAVPPGQDSIYAFRGDGTPVAGFPAGRVTSGFAGMIEAAAPTPVVAADVDADGGLELTSMVIVNSDEVGYEYVTVVDRRGVTQPGWPQLVGQTIGDLKSMAVGDVDGNGKLEIVVPKRNLPSSWMEHFAIYRPDGVLAREITFDDFVSDFGQLILVDANNDRKLELFSVGYVSGQNYWSAFLMTGDGLPVPGWSVPLPARNLEPAVFTDLDGDGDLEVAIAVLTQIYAYHLNASPVSGYPIDAFPSGGGQWGNYDITTARVASAPNGAYFYTSGGVVAAMDFQGNALPRWPKSTPFYGAVSPAALADLDGNGALDIGVHNSLGVFYLWEESSPSGVATLSDWSTEGGDNARTNARAVRNYPQVFFRGTANGWGTKLMELVADDLWQVDIEQGAGEAASRFKLDVYGDWRVNFGDNQQDGIADQGGSDIALRGPGRYRITFNDQTRQYQVQSLEAQWTRTIVLMYGQTQPGQDMFVRGGIDHGYAQQALGITCTSANGECAIPIRHLNLRNATTAPWKNGDTLLDWYGPESGQGAGAQGTALDWTTNHWPPEWGAAKYYDVDGYGETALNRWGHHYWMMEVEVDCARTVNGWFELKSFISNGPGWEANVSQPGAPYASANHFARCGYLNVFQRGESAPVAIEPLAP